MITILIFLVILGVLVFVHELGHFLVAKAAGAAVEEFGFGYPPRALKLGSKWGTLFTLNWIPFGGFVKIVGEDYETPEAAATNDSLRSNDASHTSLQERSLPPQKSFTQISKKWQAAILAAGVTFNILFAWLIFSIGFIAGLPAAVENDYGSPAKDPVLTIIDVLPDSPARAAGLKAGDKIKEISLPDGESFTSLTPQNVSEIFNKGRDKASIQIERGRSILNFDVTPQSGIVEGKKAIGIDMEMVGTVSLPVHKALYQGGRATLQLTKATVYGIGGLIGDALRGQADISNIAGPVGIVSLVGDAEKLGFSYLLTFTALISINLAIINLVPFPALDGGRILFVAIEGVSRRKINPRFAHVTNTVGFALLILLMLFITYRDILRLL